MFPQETRILIVDDMATMRTYLRDRLKELGFACIIEAQDGEAAIRTLAEQNARGESIELVFSDWNMPKMSGLELLRAVRGAEDFKTLPFVMVTTEADKKKVLQAISEGLSNFVNKPFTTEQLRERLTSVWKKHRPEIEKLHVSEERPGKAGFSELKSALHAAVVSVFREIAATDVQVDPPFTRGDGPIPETKFAAGISFESEVFQGSMVLAFPEDSFLAIVSRFLGQETNERNWRNQDGAAEMLNMIMGRMKSALNFTDLNVKPGLPAGLHGRQVANLPSFEGKSTVFPYHFDSGAFYAELLVQARRR